MERKIDFKLSSVIIAVLALLFVPSLVSAETFDITYSLIEGGYRLELDAANTYKGVKIEVTSDVSTQYEIIQTITRQLENRDNPGEILKDNFVVRGLRGTNQYGDLNIPTNDIAVRSGEIIYTSNTAGNQDNFTLVYGLLNLQDIKAGHYQGQISFTLRPISSTRSQVTKYLDVYVTITEEQEAGALIEIATATGSNLILLNSQKEEEQVKDVSVKINGTFKHQFSIKQLLLQPLRSEEGNELVDEAVNIETQGTSKVSAMPRQPLSSRPLDIYTSKINGESDTGFIITYSLGDLSTQKAGRYSSRIQYYLDEPQKQTSLGALELEVENERIFDLVIAPQDQKGTIQFANLKPKEEPKKSEVVVEVKTNIGKRYQVSQNVYSELTNKEGDVIPQKYFTLTTESLDTKGTLRIQQQTQVQKGDAVLFVSDDKGSTDKFKIVYALTCPEDLKAGDYSTRITYSLLEI